MSSERPDEFSQQSGSRGSQLDRPGGETREAYGRRDEGSRPEATVVVRGEAVRDQASTPDQATKSSDQPTKSPPRDATSGSRETTVVVRGETVRDDEEPKGRKESAPKDKEKSDKEKSPRKELSEAKVNMQRRLPALGDDADVGVQKDHLITRDGKADLTFTGTLLASAAPPSAPQGQWKEYRIYETSGGKHVFSKVTRNVEADKQDTHEAEVFDPAPSSVPSKLLKSARELTHSRPMTWTDAAVGFFGYDPLAKILYRKLSGQFEEHIS
jgi:hypothetical protein